MRKKYENHKKMNLDEYLDMNELNKDQLQKKKWIKPFILDLKKKGANEVSNFCSILRSNLKLKSEEMITIIQILILLFHDKLDNESKRELKRSNDKDKDIILTTFAIKAPKEIYFQFQDYIFRNKSSKQMKEHDFCKLKEQIENVSGIQIEESNLLAQINNQEKLPEELPPKSIEIQDDKKSSELITSNFFRIQDEEMPLTPSNYNFSDNDETYGIDSELESFLETGLNGHS